MTAPRPLPVSFSRPVRWRVSRGFLLPAAIFLLVILGSLAAFLVHVAGVQHATSTQDVMGSRAYQAAQAGIEWGLYKVLVPAPSSVAPPTDPSWPNFPACPAGDLVIEGFAVQVKCQPFNYLEAGGRNQIIVYQLIATARLNQAGLKAGDARFIERQTEVRVSLCRSEDGIAPAYACD